MMWKANKQLLNALANKLKILDQYLLRFCELHTSSIAAEKSTEQVANSSARCHAPLQPPPSSHIFDHMLMCVLLRWYRHGKCSQLQCLIATELVINQGAVRFVQSLLCSDHTEDIGIAVALQELVPAVQEIATHYPDIFFDEANQIIAGYQATASNRHGN